MVLQLPAKDRFTDRWGITRPVFGCSLLGRDAFWQGVAELAGRLAEAAKTDTFQQMYDWDKQVKFLVDHLLTLNGIDPDWVTLDQAEIMLCGKDGGEGWLVALNKPKAKPDANKKKAGEPLTTEEIIASLSLQTGGSIEEAIRLASELPAEMIINILEGRANLTAPPKEQRRRKIRKHKDELLADLDRVHEAEVAAAERSGEQHV